MSEKGNIGRPPSDVSKRDTFKVRMDAKTGEMLDYCSKTMNTSRSDIVRKGIRLIYENLKKSNNL